MARVLASATVFSKDAIYDLLTPGNSTPATFINVIANVLDLNVKIIVQLADESFTICSAPDSSHGKSVTGAVLCTSSSTSGNSQGISHCNPILLSRPCVCSGIFLPNMELVEKLGLFGADEGLAAAQQFGPIPYLVEKSRYIHSDSKACTAIGLQWLMPWLLHLTTLPCQGGKRLRVTKHNSRAIVHTT